MQIKNSVLILILESMLSFLPEPILPVRRIRKLRRAPETPGGRLLSKMI